MTENKSLDFLLKVPKPWKFLAPMVSNSEEAYRNLARRYGADLCYTEMVHCKGFNSGKPDISNNFWYSTNKDDRPLVIQICGNDPDQMLETCLKIQHLCDAIDINFGCPQEIARKGNYGSYLMEDLGIVERIVTTLSESIKIPLFCKIRIFKSVDKTVEYAKLLERSGCALLVVHGRERSQKGPDTGLPSWDHIKAVKMSLKIPVVANGGMIYHKNIEECVKYTGCDGVMIAEPHLYNPTIFTEERRFSIDIFEEYLNIIEERPTSAKLKHIKSHAFKIMKTLLLERRDLLIPLDKCRKIEDYFEFIRNVRLLAKSGEILTEWLELRPYIRNSPNQNDNNTGDVVINPVING